jgi:hypothetical protein
VLALLQLHDAQEMKRIKMTRQHRQHGPILLLGVSQSALLMKGDSSLKYLLNVGYGRHARVKFRASLG